MKKDNITGYPNFYVSKRGRVWKRIRDGTWKELRYIKNPTRGYLYVSLSGKHFRLNRLVAMVYIPNPENKAYVCHKDNNPCNNHIDNLYWGTPSENTQQCIRDGRGYIGDKNPRAKVKNIDREIIRRKFTLGSTINELTKEYNLSRSAIRKILYLSI